MCRWFEPKACQHWLTHDLTLTTYDVLIKFDFIYRDDGAMSTTEISVIASNTTGGGQKMLYDKNI